MYAVAWRRGNLTCPSGDNFVVEIRAGFFSPRLIAALKNGGGAVYSDDTYEYVFLIEDLFKTKEAAEEEALMRRVKNKLQGQEP